MNAFLFALAGVVIPGLALWLIMWISTPIGEDDLMLEIDVYIRNLLEDEDRLT